MYQEVTDLLDEIGYAFDRHELKMCMIRSQKKKILKAMIAHSHSVGFDLSTNKNKTILASIACTPDLGEDMAIRRLKSYISSDLNQAWNEREELMAGAVRHTEEFNMLLILSGDATVRSM
ncbi:hypothetical protein L1D41_06115 [Vibrio harveyi]|uniref:hypothetical protein n=1 Tax=Vibrio harveyi TaxID=669 RepID=UPI001EFCD352|nr:hypothetical protein [Vibrio harveyi]MCG9609261.1 hypothetical protein [Vibrio harveyi]MCG9667294.1 hypothetical protein [Vibrio harveyi]